jgi:cytoskeletal protein CcmA (bactofilin family)
MKWLHDQLKLVLVALASVLLVMGMLPATALAADTRQGQTVTVGPNEVVNDDLYVAANTVEIQGTINGNLIAFGSTIDVSGTVTRDMMASGGTITIPGEVQGSVRVAGAQVTVSGKIAGDLVAAAGTLNVNKEATIGRDVLASASNARFAGSIARNVQIAGGNVAFSGPVGGNVTAWDTNLKLDSGAAIQGNLNYNSSNNASIAGGAAVTGTTNHTFPSNVPNLGVSILGWFQTLVGFFVLGVLLVLIAPRFNAKAVEAYKTSPWSRLGIGLAVLLGVPIVALFVFVLGLIVGGWWLSLFLLGIYWLALSLGFVIVSEMIGRFTLERLSQAKVHPIPTLLLGLVMLLVVSVVPWVGWIGCLLAVIYGLGVVVMALPWTRPPAQPAPAMVTPPAGLVRPTPSAG